MKVLLLAPSYLELYKPILDTMRNMGHDVTYIEDITPPFYPYYKRGFLNGLLYRTYNIFKNIDYLYKQYWDAIIKEYHLQDYRYDVFFCINGTSLHHYFINFIDRNNPKIFKTMYLWDTNKYYDFARFIKCFHKVFTFDFADSKELSVNYLPFYYLENKNVLRTFKYDAFCIGSLHDNRLAILDEISKQLDSYSLTYIFKVVYVPIRNTIKNEIRYYLSFLINDKVERDERKYKMGLLKHKLLTTTIYPVDVYNELMHECKVIIDTDRQSQVGLTPRLVWAIASGKNIITTNSNIVKDPYCPQDGIWIIDRNKPQITKEMFKNNRQYVLTDEFEKLEIHQWICNFVQNND